MAALPDPVQLAIPAFVALLLLELAVTRRWAHLGRYEWRDASCSLALGFGSLVAGAFTAGAVAWALALAHEHRLATVPVTWWSIALCFVADDLAYYWFHRSAHRVRWFWASHAVHHGSTHYNLATALRQTWTGFISLSFILRLPLALIGFAPELILFCAGLNLVYQYWIHTEAVRRLPRWFEAVFNTPSHHRVHHATNPRYLDRNYAGVFIVWDKLFATFEPERDDDAPRYGLIHPLDTFNPVKVAMREWLALARDLGRHPHHAWSLITKPPGWTPHGTEDTADAIRARWLAESRPAE